MNKLDEAKLNLKAVLEKLEIEFDKRLESNSLDHLNGLKLKISELEALNQSLQAEINEKNDEILYLREQNHESQVKLGELNERNMILHNRNSEAVKKFDTVIADVKEYLTNKGLM